MEIEEVYPEDFSQLQETVRLSDSPLVVRGLVSDWPIVKKAELDETIGYLRRFYSGLIMPTMKMSREDEDRFFYGDRASDMNFETLQLNFDELMEGISSSAEVDQRYDFYAGAVPLDRGFPGFRHFNKLPFRDVNPQPFIWIGNRTQISAHTDQFENLACVCCGVRRFTLFPPEQVSNLYVGSLEISPANRPISMVDPIQPDFDEFPKFAEALQHAQHAELNPGDAIYIPKMWWHQVEATSSLNILVNFWWRESPGYLPSADDALLHSILAIRNLPENEKSAWKAFFDFYVFDEDPERFDHIPEHLRGVLGELDVKKIDGALARFEQRLSSGKPVNKT